MKKLTFLLFFLLLSKISFAQKTPITVFKDENVYWIKQPNGSTETIYTKNAEVWYTSSTMKKKTKLNTISYKKEPGENAYAKWKVNFVGDTKSVFALSVYVGDEGKLEMQVIDPKGGKDILKELNYNYQGNIGGIPIKFLFLNEKGGTEDFTGHYFYEHIGVPIEVRGSYYTQNNNILFSTDSNSETFESDRKIDGFQNPPNINGTWSMEKPRKQLPFKLKRR